MNNWSNVLLLCGAFGCGSSVTIEGRLVDGMGGGPITEIGIVARSLDPQATMSCATFDAATDSNGAFTLEGLCGGEYRIELGDDSWWLAEGDTVTGGQPAEFKAWRAPKGDGMHLLAGADIAPVKSTSVTKKLKVAGHDDLKVFFPAEIPPKVDLVDGDKQIVIVGRDTIEKTKIHSLVPANKVPFKKGDDIKVRMPYVYVGVKITETEDKLKDDVMAVDVEQLSPLTFDTSKVMVKERGQRVAWFVSADALPAGRYVLMAEGDRTMTILDFGKAWVPPPPETDQED